ncbi:MAG: carboxypeptidase-like regulatory domain-containing protein [Planctomycetota bacterium]
MNLRTTIAVALIALAWLGFRRAGAERAVLASAGGSSALGAAGTVVDGQMDLVLEAEDGIGRPVTRLELRLEPSEQDGRDPSHAREVVAAAGAPILRTLTAPDGRYALDGLPHGRWRISVAAPPLTILEPPPGTELTLPLRAPLLVRAEAPAALTALVIDSQGRPTAGASVQFDPARAAPRREFTGSDGRAVADRLPVGFVAVQATKGPVTTQGRIALSDGERRELVLRLPGGRVTGVVVDARGTPQANRKVDVVTGDRLEARLDSAVSDDEGRFSLPVLPPGALRIRAGKAAQDVLLDDGSSVDVRLQLPAQEGSGALTGRLLIGEQPVPETELTWIANPGPRAGTLGEGQRTFVVRTDRAGRYSVALDATDPWVLLAALPGRPSISLGAFTRGDDATRDLDLPTGDLEGRLVDGDGRGIGGAAIECVPATPWTFGPQHAAPVEARTAADGTFIVSGLVVGPWVVHATPAAGTAPERALARVRSQPVEVVAGGSSTSVELVTGRAGRALLRFEGTAVDTGDALLVELRSAAGRYLFAKPLAWRGARSDGIPVGGLPPGSYRCAVRTAHRASSWTAPIVITAGETTEAMIALANGAEVTVVIRDASGEPLPSALTLLDEGGDDVTRLAQPRSPGPGRYALGPLIDGRYTLVARGLDGSGARRQLLVEGGQSFAVEIRAED